VIVGFGGDTLVGASPLPACSGGTRLPDSRYADALARVPSADGVVFALPLRLAEEAEELPRLGAKLALDPALEVVSVEVVALADLGGHAPSEEVAALLSPTGARGILSVPAYQDASGAFQVDEDGVPIPTGTTGPGFIVILPETGAPPYPFVLFQHGGGQNKLDVLQLAGPLAAAGFALVAIDLPAHGDRAPDQRSGTDLDILDFDAPILSRDNLRQASADHLAVLSGVAALNVALESVLDVADALDPERRFYMGLSLGALTGTFTTVSSDVLGAALFVGGGGYPEVLSEGLFALILADVTRGSDLEVASRFALVELMLDGADPLAYASVEDRQQAPKPILFFQAHDDPLICEAANDGWARAFGATLVRPLTHEVDGMAIADLPLSNNFAWGDGGELATRTLVQAPMAEVEVVDRHAALIVLDYSQQMVAHCFAALAQGEACELIDTGYSEH
jgi:pimeloyl-ACP methyl ester carboxylesterase